jgi:predicted anti-sigma-YlaC factor YlaD
MNSYETTTNLLRHQDLYTTCTIVQDLLPLYAEQEVSEASRVMIDEHVRGCHHCRGFMAGSQSIQRQLRSTQPQAPTPPPIPPLANNIVYLLLQKLVLVPIIIFAGMGGMGTMMLVLGMPFMGLFIGGVAFLGLLATALQQRRLTLTSLTQIASATVTGAFACALLTTAETIPSMLGLLGIPLALLTLILTIGFGPQHSLVMQPHATGLSRMP